MANPNKAKGTSWESSVRDYLNSELGLYVDDWRDRDVVTPFRNPADPMNVRRAAQEGVRDVGDIHAAPFVLEAKDVASKAVPTWLRQAKVEAKWAGMSYGVVVHKVRNANVRRGRVYIALRTWTHLRLVLGLTARQMVSCYSFTPSLRGLDTSRWYMTTDLEMFADILAVVRVLSYAE